MVYIESNLLPDEQIVYKAKPHWIVFLETLRTHSARRRFSVYPADRRHDRSGNRVDRPDPVRSRLHDVGMWRHQQAGNCQSRIDTAPHAGAVVAPRGIKA